METTLWDDLREPPTRMQRWSAVLRKQPSAFLLAVQLLVIILLPWLQDLTYGRVALSVLSLCALTVAVFTVRSTPALTWLSVTLGLPAAILEIWSTVADDNALIAFDLSTGRRRWRHGMNAYAAVVQPDVVYVRDSRSLRAIDAATGAGP